MLSKEFVTAGRAIFTLEVPKSFRDEKANVGVSVKPHYTYKIAHKESDGKFPEAWFISMLTGPDNNTNYSYLGMLEITHGTVRLTAKSPWPETSIPVVLIRRVLANIWADTQQNIKNAGFQLHHEGKCGRCGRTLTTPESCELGIGPECIKFLLQG